MPMSLAQLTVATGSLLLLSAVMFLMLQRNLRTAYPLFYTYLSANVLAIIVGVAVYHFAIAQYFFVFWTMSAVLMLLGFGVLYEVFVNLLKPYSALIDLGKMLFVWTALFLLLAGFLTALVTSGSQPTKARIAIDLCDRCVHLMTCGSMLLLILFEKRLNFSWRNSGMCIALGLGMSSALDLMVSYGHSLFPASYAELALFNGFAFMGILAFWALRLMGTDLVPATSASSPSRLILQRWNEALIGYRYGDLALAPSHIESFLPGVEQTVDRVLARKMV